MNIKVGEGLTVVALQRNEHYLKNDKDVLDTDWPDVLPRTTPLSYPVVFLQFGRATRGCIRLNKGALSKRLLCMSRLKRTYRVIIYHIYV